jgi:hypothetical protein
MSSSYAAGLIANHYNLAQFIEPNPINYKINRSSNTNYANISYKRRISQILKLDGYSQQVNRISRMSPKIQFGNFYLGQPLNINYLGRSEGMSGGSGKPPINRFY